MRRYIAHLRQGKNYIVPKLSPTIIPSRLHSCLSLPERLSKTASNATSAFPSIGLRRHRPSPPAASIPAISRIWWRRLLPSGPFRGWQRWSAFTTDGSRHVTTTNCSAVCFSGSRNGWCRCADRKGGRCGRRCGARGDVFFEVCGRRPARGRLIHAFGQPPAYS